MWKQNDKLASEQCGRDPNSAPPHTHTPPPPPPPPPPPWGQMRIVATSDARFLTLCGAAVGVMLRFECDSVIFGRKVCAGFIIPSSSQKTKQDGRLLVWVSVYMMVEKRRLLGNAKCPVNGHSWEVLQLPLAFIKRRSAQILVDVGAVLCPKLANIS